MTDTEKLLSKFYQRDPKGTIFAVGTITQFGGREDKEDNGLTACGFSTIDTDVLYCALPIPVWRRYNLRCGIRVGFYNRANGKSVNCVLWDKGPSVRLQRVGDIAPKAMELLGGDGLLVNVEVQIHRDET